MLFSMQRSVKPENANSCSSSPDFSFSSLFGCRNERCSFEQAQTCPNQRYDKTPKRVALLQQSERKEMFGSAFHQIAAINISETSCKDTTHAMHLYQHCFRLRRKQLCKNIIYSICKVHALQRKMHVDLSQITAFCGPMLHDIPSRC